MVISFLPGFPLQEPGNFLKPRFWVRLESLDLAGNSSCHQKGLALTRRKRCKTMIATAKVWHSMYLFAWAIP
jgi:hypothetical protein